MTDPWWIQTVATSYAQVLLSDFFDSGAYNGTGAECALVTVARALKAVNPNIKVLIYVAASDHPTHPPTPVHFVFCCPPVR